jgi:hypothetical protein
LGVLTIELGPLPTRIQLQCRQPLGSSDQPFGGLQSFVDAHQVGHGTGLLARRPGAEDRQLNELMAFADVLEQTSAFEAGQRFVIEAAMPDFTTPKSRCAAVDAPVGFA